MKKICAGRWSRSTPVSSPTPCPPVPVAIAALVQLGICVPNWEVQKHVPQDGPQWTDIVDQVIEVRDGYRLAPTGPVSGSSSTTRV